MPTLKLEIKDHGVDAVSVTAVYAIVQLTLVASDGQRAASALLSPKEAFNLASALIEAAKDARKAPS
jgi:hypothetical protein